MNILVISGRLTRKPEVNTSGSDVWVRFHLALDRQVAKDANGNRPTDFLSFSAYGKTAETMAQWAVQGQMIEVQGHIQTSTAVKDDETRYYTNLIADRIQFGAKPRSSYAENGSSDLLEGAPELDGELVEAF